MTSEIDKHQASVRVWGKEYQKCIASDKFPYFLKLFVMFYLRSSRTSSRWREKYSAVDLVGTRIQHSVCKNPHSNSRSFYIFMRNGVFVSLERRCVPLSLVILVHFSPLDPLVR